MMPGPALLAVEAALDSSPDADSEIRALLRANDWRHIVVGTLAIARRGDVGSLKTDLLHLVGEGHVGATAAVALLRAGVSPDAIVARCPTLSLANQGTPYRSGIQWCDLVRRRLEYVETWPALEEQPPPLSW